MKFDDDKVPLHLIDPLWLNATAQVLAHGEKKYGAWNWAKGTFEWHRIYRAALAHLNAWYGGQDIDAESGLPHLWHANCCLMFLTRYAHDGMGRDTRPVFPFVERETRADRDRIIEQLASFIAEPPQMPSGEAVPDPQSDRPYVAGAPRPEREPKYFPPKPWSKDEPDEDATEESTPRRSQ